MSQSRRNFFLDTTLTALALPLASVFVPDRGRSIIEATKTIPTITGSIHPEQMGLTLMHEHVMFKEIPDQYRTQTVDHAVALLKDAARVGVKTIVDLTPTRDITLFQAIAEKAPSDMNIIVSTGAYLNRRSPKWILDMNEKQFKSHVITEVTQGIQRTKIRAGIIKVAAASTPMTDWEKMVFKVAAEVQKEYGTPIATHATHEPRNQFDHLLKHGANPDKLFFSHIEATFGWGGRTRQQMAVYLTDLARQGGHLLFNNFGYEFDTPWQDMVYLIRTICDNGYQSKIFTSVDCYWFWQDGQILTNVEEVHPETKQRTYSYMITDAVPAMLKAGFSAKEIKTFLIDNPMNFFS